MTDPTTPALSRWQDPQNDGFPTEAYFDAVERAFTAAGITIADGWHDEPWDFSFKLGKDSRKGYAELYINWRVGEYSEPLAGKWAPLQSGICGWYAVPVSHGREQEALGDRAVDFNLDVIAKPEQVAAAVVELVKGSGR